MKKKYFSLLVLATLVSPLFEHPVVADETLLTDNFSYSNGVITNEFTYWNPGYPGTFNNPLWEMDSGSFFCQNGAGWTGVPDDRAPNINSSNGNNSAIMRLKTKRANFGDVTVSFSLLNQGLKSTPSTPAVDWDGIHIWLRYQSEAHLYYASINRRDNTVVIKKKVPGGPSNGGTYYNLSSYVPFTVPYNTWQQVKASVQNNANGSVTIKLFSGNTLLVSAVDNGSVGGAPIRAAGRVGMRGDNANLKFDNFAVTSIGGSAPPPSRPAAPTGLYTHAGNTTVLIGWNAVAGATSYNLYRSRYQGVTKANGYKITNVARPYLNTNFVNGTRYYMVVTAVNASGESLDSQEISSTPLLGPPAPPAGVAAVAGNTQIKLSWNPVPGAIAYNIYRSRYAGVTKQNGYKLATVTSPYINRALVNGTKVYMVVTAVGPLGESHESVEVSATPFSGGGSFSVALDTFDADLSAFRVYPNPWKTDQHVGLPVTFDHLTDSSEVKIFTVSGQFVTEFNAASSMATWDLRDRSGEKVASGLYIYLVTDGHGENKKGTLAVVQ